MKCPLCMERIFQVYTGGLFKYDETPDGSFSRVFICDECADRLERLGFTIKFAELVDNEGDSENKDWCCHFCHRSSKEKV